MAVRTNVTISDDSATLDVDQGNSVIDNNNEIRSGVNTSYEVRPDVVVTSDLDIIEKEDGRIIFDDTDNRNKYWDGTQWISVLSEDELQDSVKEDIQGYYTVISKWYSGDAAVRAENPVIEVLEDTWTKLEITPLSELDETPDAQKALGIFDAADNRFSLGGLDSGSNIVMRTLVRLRPDVDEGSASLRLNFTTNSTTQAGGLTNFTIESQLFNMTQGADIDYQDESIITAFVGSTLDGIDIANAGSFVMEINSTVDTDLEVLAFTLYINK
mgnify:CR=1 FL=1